jgi:hypothetical protein
MGRLMSMLLELQSCQCSALGCHASRHTFDSLLGNGGLSFSRHERASNPLLSAHRSSQAINQQPRKQIFSPFIEEYKVANSMSKGREKAYMFCQSFLLQR